MGLLHQVFGQVLGGGAASRAGEVQTGGAPGDGPGGLPSGNRGQVAMALLALLASKRLKGRAGGHGSVLQEVFSGGRSDGISGAFSSSRDGLGGILGRGLTGAALAGGLGELLNRFTRNGHGKVAQSWVGHGPNTPVSPDQLYLLFEPGEVDELTRQTGLGRNDLLSQLSGVLPEVVDTLTPQGRLPTEAEHSQWI
ncbi:YidB family protein [uncultured Enterovirga sp.]|uniref:YidB family protein n=1 Tax=uncultured Enterovirga sp. TaxID=2026352 RepID=UPI0035CCA634